VGQARARDLLEERVQPLAALQQVQKRRERAQLHRRRADAGQVVGDARDLADDDPDVLGAPRDAIGDAEELLHGHRVAAVVDHRRDVVQPIGVREDLRVGRVLGFLLEAAVEVAGLDVALHDLLAVDGEHDAHGAVHGRVRRAHVDGHELVRQLGLGVELGHFLAAEDEGLQVSHGAHSRGDRRSGLLPSRSPRLRATRSRSRPRSSSAAAASAMTARATRSRPAPPTRAPQRAPPRAPAPRTRARRPARTRPQQTPPPAARPTQTPTPAAPSSPVTPPPATATQCATSGGTTAPAARSVCRGRATAGTRGT
jgi:hypothetical protein